MDVPILFLWSQETKRHFRRGFAQRLTRRSALAAAARAAESPNSGAGTKTIGELNGSSSRHHRGLHRYPDARLHGWIEARARGQGRWPPIKIVATSGQLDLRETDLPEGGRFLAKPYGPLDIAGVLRELIGGG
jgi:hypothetical protein